MKKIFVSILTLALLLGVMPFSLVSASSSESFEELGGEVSPAINPNPPEFGGTPAKMRACLNNKIKNNWKEISGVTIISQALDDIMNKKWTSGAKKLIKGGAKGGAVAIAGQLIYYNGVCAVNS